MSEVTVKAMQPVLGLDDGAVVTIERTTRIDNAIKAGRLVVISETLDPEPAPEPVVAEPETPRTKRVKKLAGLDKDDA